VVVGTDVYLGNAERSPTLLGSYIGAGAAFDQEYVTWKSLVGAGDLDGDGYADLAAILHVQVYRDGTGRVEFLPGAAGGPDLTEASVVVDLPYADTHGPRGAAAGDLDGDGFGELLVGLDGDLEYGGSGSVAVLEGGTGDPAVTEDTLLSEGGSWGAFGTCAAPTGDLDGDGYGDLVVGAWEIDTVYVYAGGAAGVDPTPTGNLTPSDSGSWFGFGASCAGPGDVDGDGLPDIVVASDTTDRLYLYLGAGEAPDEPGDSGDTAGGDSADSAATDTAESGDSVPVSGDTAPPRDSADSAPEDSASEDSGSGKEPEGCGCRAAGDSAVPGFALALLLVARRRRGSV
jgi:hypothetical protein